MSRRSSEASARGAAATRTSIESHRWLRGLPLALGLAACTTVAPPPHPRPPIPLANATRETFALPGPVQTLDLEVNGGDVELDYWRGRLGCGDERVHFHMLRPKGDAPRPLVACLPILGGGQTLMWLVASRIAARGYAAVWTDRVAPALRNQRGPELDALFRRTVQHNRVLLHWARGRPDLFTPGQQGLVGLSTGGIVGAVLLALEPDVAAGALCLAGADLPTLLMSSEEPRVTAWRRWRAHEDGISGATLQLELDRCLAADPAYFCAAVAPDRVLLVHADLDAVVGLPNQDLLWEGLGRPRRIRVRWLGHYTTALGLDPIIGAICAHLADRLPRHAGT